MPRNKPRKTEKGSFTREAMEKAIQNRKLGMSLRAAAEKEGVNYQTQDRYMKNLGDMEVTAETRLTPHYNVRQVFTEDQENQLVEYILERSKLGYGMTAVGIRKLACELAQANNLSARKNWEENSIAGEDWFTNFMKRHTNLSIRKPEQCSIARGIAFNKFTIDNYFIKLEDALKRHPTFRNGSRVYNLDETATSTVGSVTKRIISPKGEKQVHQIKSLERGVTVDTCCIINAHGAIVPPAMIFPRVKFTHDMISGAYPGTKGLATKKGWMTGEMFVEVLQHFIECTGSSKEKPSLLIVDNVETHLTLDAIVLCKENGVTLFTLPPHTTHRTQPLDVGVFGPFKSAYNRAHEDWGVSHPFRVCSIKDVASIVNIAMMRSFTPQNIISAFSSTGIFPFNSQIFSEEDFYQSKVSERPNPANSTDTPLPSTSNNSTEVIADFVVNEHDVLPNTSILDQQNVGMDPDDMDEDEIPAPPANTFITPAMLQKYPRVEEKTQEGNKKENYKGKREK